MKFDFHLLLSEKYLKLILAGGIGILSILILLELSQLHRTPKMPLSTHSKQPVVSPAQHHFETAVHTALFGTYVPDDIRSSEVQQSLLNVTVAGILLSDKSEKSQVIIRLSDNEEKVFQIGDTIPGNAVIKRITENAVFVEHDGNLESLALPKNDLNFEPAIEPLKGDSQ